MYRRDSYHDRDESMLKMVSTRPAERLSGAWMKGKGGQVPVSAQSGRVYADLRDVEGDSSCSLLVRNKEGRPGMLRREDVCTRIPRPPLIWREGNVEKKAGLAMMT
jgi:hypothetical protein